MKEKVDEELEKRTISALVKALDVEDEEARKCAQQALLDLKSQQAIDELCKIYLQDKKHSLWKIINQKGFAPEDIKEKVIFYLKTNQRIRCLTLGKQAIRPLVSLLSDDDEGIREKAEVTLSSLTNQEAIDELCQETKFEPVLKIVKNKGYSPSTNKVLFYLKTDQLSKCLELKQEALLTLIQLLDSNDTTIVQKATQTLKSIEDNYLKEELFQIYFSTKNQLLKEILKDKNWLPNQSEDKALFYLFSNQLDRYFELDVKATLLKKSYEKANLNIKQNLIDVILQIKDDYFFDFLIEILRDENNLEIIKAILHFFIQNDGNAVKQISPIFPYLNDDRLNLFVNILGEKNTQLSSQLLFELIKKAKKGYLTLKAIKILEDRNWSPVTQITLFNELSQIRKKVFSYNLQLLTQHSSPTAALALGELGDSGAINELIKVLEFKDAQMRKNAAIALGEIGNRSVNEFLIKALKDEASEVRIAAAQALLMLEDKEAVSVIIRALKDRVWTVRSKSAQILGLLQDKRAVEPLIEALQDTEWEVKENAACSLGYLKDKRAVEPLIKALSDHNQQVRTKASWALGEIGDKTAIYPLEFALKDESWQVRAQAFYSLAKLGDRKVIGTLRRYLQDVSQRVRIVAAHTLIILGDTKAFEILINALTSKKADVRKQAVSALGELGDKRAVNYLINALYDEDWKVRCETASALAKIGDVSAVEHLIISLNDSVKEVRIASAKALAQLGDSRAIEPLLRGLLTKPKIERRIFVQTLSHIGNEAVIEPLIQILQDEDIEGEVIVTDAICNLISNLPTKDDAQQIKFLQHILKKLDHLYQNKHNKSAGVEKYFLQISLLILKAQVKDIVIIRQKKSPQSGKRDIVITHKTPH